MKTELILLSLLTLSGIFLFTEKSSETFNSSDNITGSENIEEFRAF